MATNVFKDRQSDNPNRRKLTIIQQNGDEMIVDVERADTNVREPGTPFNASVLNDWNDKVNTAHGKALQAETDSQQALTKSTTAEANATSANNDAALALRKVNALVTNVDFSQIAGDGAPSVDLINNSDGTKRFSFKNLKGSKGDNVHIRYSFNKTSMTEEPANNTAYIGFYYGETASTNVNDYAWTQIWGAKAISATQYAQLVTDGNINPEQVYFIEGSSDGEFIVCVDASTVAYSNAESGLDSTTIQDAIDELKQKMPMTLAKLSEKSYNSLTDKPNIPTNETMRLADMAEKSYNSLTDKPTIPTSISELSERSYNSLTDKPLVPTRLSDLSEKSYNSLTDKPPVVNQELIASILGIPSYKLETLAAFLNSLEFDGEGFRLFTNFVDINN